MNKDEQAKVKLREQGYYEGKQGKKDRSNKLTGTAKDIYKDGYDAGKAAKDD